MILFASQRVPQIGVVRRSLQRIIVVMLLRHSSTPKPLTDINVRKAIGLNHHKPIAVTIRIKSSIVLYVKGRDGTCECSDAVAYLDGEMAAGAVDAKVCSEVGDGVVWRNGAFGIPRVGYWF